MIPGGGMDSMSALTDLDLLGGGQTGSPVLDGTIVRRARLIDTSVSAVMAIIAAVERRKAGEVGEEADAPAITYAVVPGSTPSAVAATKGQRRTPEKAAARLIAWKGTPGTMRRSNTLRKP